MNDHDRLDFVREHTRLADVPLVPELRVRRADAVTPVWFELARFLDDDDVDVPFWCVPWAGGQALARYVLDHSELVRGKRVLDFACGDGLVAMAATRAGGRVHACDVDPFARVVTRLDAADRRLGTAVCTATRRGAGALRGADAVRARGSQRAARARPGVLGVTVRKCAEPRTGRGREYSLSWSV